MGVFKDFKACNDKLEFILGAKEAWKEVCSKKFYRQIPNILSASRLLTPFVVLPIVLSGHYFASLITLGGFALTDAFDGRIASWFHLQSDFGKKLDPICDKFFNVALALPLLSLNPLMALVAATLEVAIVIINGISSSKNNHPETSNIGKIKTNVLIASTLLLYGLSFFLSPALMTVLSSVFLLPTVGLQGYVAYQYWKTDQYKDSLKKEKGFEKQDDFYLLEQTEKKEQLTYGNAFRLMKEAWQSKKKVSREEQIALLEKEKVDLTKQAVEEKKTLIKK